MWRLRLIAVAMAAVLGLLGSAHAADDAKAAPAAITELLTKDVQVSADGSSVVTFHAELRAVNEAGALQISQISVPFISSLQELEIVEAHTLKPDGTKIPVNVGTIYEQIPQNAAQFAMITDLRVKILLFPQFTAGDTAVYTFKLKSPHPLIAGEFVYGDVFLRGGSYKEVRETITAPRSMNLRAEAHDVDLSKRTEGDNTVITVHYSAPQPTTQEDDEVSPIDHEPRFFVSSFKDYAELGRAYGALSQPKIVVTPRVQSLADQITSQVTDRRDQARKLYDWVVQNIRYVAIELGAGSLTPHDVDTILANGYGDCKDHDVLLQSLLKAKGIAAESMLINSGNAYTLTDVPTFTQLDHVITRLPEFDLYLDSNLLAPFGVLPKGEYGKPGVHVSATGASLGAMPVLPPGASSVTMTTVSRLDSKGVLTGTTTTTATGPSSIGLRLAGIALQAVGSDKAAELQLALQGYKDATGKFDEDPVRELWPGYTIRGSFTAPGLTNWLSGGESKPLPAGLRLMGFTGDGPMGRFGADLPKNVQPIVCYSDTETEDISLDLPPGTVVAKVPQDTKVETPTLRFTAKWSVSGSRISVHREFVSTIDKPLCSVAVRRQNSDALKKIADSYDEEIWFTRSVEDYTKTIAENPGDVSALIRRAQGYVTQGKFDDAFRDLDQAMKLKPDDTWVLLSRGNAHQAMGNSELALADFNKALALDPGYEDAYLARGRSFEATGDYARALQDFDSAVKLDPKDAEALAERGRAYWLQKQPDRAVADIDAALALQPNNSFAYAARGLVHSSRGELAPAIKDYDQAIALDPKNTWAIGNRGLTYLASGDEARGLQDLAAVLSVEPKNQFVLRSRAGFYSRSGEFELAVKDYNALIVLVPGDSKILTSRGDAYRGLKRYDRAIEDYDAAIALAPGDFDAYAGRASAYVSQHKDAVALSDCEKLVADNPGKGWPYLICSQVKRALGDDKGANLAVASALKLDPSLADKVSMFDPVAHTAKTNPREAAIGQAMLHMTTGMYDEAADDFERAMKLGAPEQLALNGLCRALAHTDRLGEATYQCSRALGVNPYDGYLLEARGYAYFRLGKYKDALEDFDKAVTTYPQDPRYLYERGATKAKMGDGAGGKRDMDAATKKKSDVARAVPPKMRS